MANNRTRLKFITLFDRQRLDDHWNTYNPTNKVLLAKATLNPENNRLEFTNDSIRFYYRESDGNLYDQQQYLVPHGGNRAILTNTLFHYFNTGLLNRSLRLDDGYRVERQYDADKRRTHLKSYYKQSKSLGKQYRRFKKRRSDEPVEHIETTDYNANSWLVKQLVYLYKDNMYLDTHLSHFIENGLCLTEVVHQHSNKPPTLVTTFHNKYIGFDNLLLRLRKGTQHWSDQRPDKATGEIHADFNSIGHLQAIGDKESDLYRTFICDTEGNFIVKHVSNDDVFTFYFRDASGHLIGTVNL